jgi:hypothetical protein
MWRVGLFYIVSRHLQWAKLSMKPSDTHAPCDLEHDDRVASGSANDCVASGSTNCAVAVHHKQNKIKQSYLDQMDLTIVDHSWTQCPATGTS